MRFIKPTNKTVELNALAPAQLQDFLIENLKSEGRNKIKALLKYRAVLVNGRPVSKYDYKLKTGDTIKVAVTQDRTVAQNPLLNIIFEDEDIIAINKPAGLLSIATDKEAERTAYHLLMEYVKEKDKENRVYIVHRLDRDTSGVLVIAKNEKIKLALQDHWGSIVKTRGYIAVVEGTPKKESDRLVSWLRETSTHHIYSSGRKGDGLEAITNYQTIKKGDDYTLLAIDLETGRKNQIRVQLQDMGHPIAGDKKYDALTNPLKRLCLHANKLAFIHPYTNELLTLETPIPKEFNRIVKTLNKEV